jgi:hypothetical protein
MKKPHDYAHLWSNPNDGWVLLRINREALSLTVRFSGDGPNLREVAAMRSAVPQFNAMPPSEAFEALKGRTEIPLGQFDSQEGRRLAEKCKNHGLSLNIVAIDHSGYLPFNEKTSMSLIIEDDALAKQVYQEALARGIRVKHIEA